MGAAVGSIIATIMTVHMITSAPASIAVQRCIVGIAADIAAVPGIVSAIACVMADTKWRG